MKFLSMIRSFFNNLIGIIKETSNNYNETDEPLNYGLPEFRDPPAPPPSPF